MTFGRGVPIISGAGSRPELQDERDSVYYSHVGTDNRNAVPTAGGIDGLGEASPDEANTYSIRGKDDQDA